MVTTREHGDPLTVFERLEADRAVLVLFEDLRVLVFLVALLVHFVDEVLQELALVLIPDICAVVRDVANLCLAPEATAAHHEAGVVEGALVIV